MLYAKALPEATVIVSEDRVDAIRLAKKKGQTHLLNTCFFPKAIAKIDILMKPNPEPVNSFCLPSGPYREPRFLYQKADLIITEGVDFFRRVEVVAPTRKNAIGYRHFQTEPFRRLSSR